MCLAPLGSLSCCLVLCSALKVSLSIWQRGVFLGSPRFCFRSAFFCLAVLSLFFFALLPQKGGVPTGPEGRCNPPTPARRRGNMAGVLLLLGCCSTGTEGNWSPLRRTGCGLICIWLWEFAGAGYDRFGLRFVFFPLPSSPLSLLRAYRYTWDGHSWAGHVFLSGMPRVVEKKKSSKMTWRLGGVLETSELHCPGSWVRGAIY